jgi:hypothetical protein
MRELKGMGDDFAFTGRVEHWNSDRDLEAPDFQYQAHAIREQPNEFAVYRLYVLPQRLEGMGHGSSRRKKPTWFKWAGFFSQVHG